MVWIIEFASAAAKALEKLDRSNARRIVAFLADRVASSDDPRSLGKALKGAAMSDYCRFRVGDFRIICELQDKRLVVLVVAVGHRSDIYR